LSILFLGTVEKRSAEPDFGDAINDNVKSFLGGTCIVDGDCSAISYCYQSVSECKYFKLNIQDVSQDVSQDLSRVFILTWTSP
jgi:hypothetical protein